MFRAELLWQQLIKVMEFSFSVWTSNSGGRDPKLSRGFSRFDGWCVSGMCGSISALGEMLLPPLGLYLACPYPVLLRTSQRLSLYNPQCHTLFCRYLFISLHVFTYFQPCCPSFTVYSPLPAYFLLIQIFCLVRLHFPISQAAVLSPGLQQQPHLQQWKVHSHRPTADSSHE